MAQAKLDDWQHVTRTAILCVAWFTALSCSTSTLPSSEPELLQRASSLQERREYQAAEKLLDEAILTHPEWRTARLKFGALLVQLDRPQLALPILQKLSAEYPTAEVHYQLGLAEHALGTVVADTTAAKGSFEAALKDDPTHLGAMTALGVLEEESGKMDKARSRWEEVISIDPTYAPAQANLGRVFARKRQYARAEIHYLAAVNASPSFGQAIAGLGLVYRAQGKDDAARALWEKAILETAVAVDVLPFLVDLLNETARQQDALATIQQVVAGEPKNPAPYLLLVAQLQTVGAPAKQALKTLEQAVAILPEDPDLQLALGKQFIEVGSLKEAEDALRSAVRLRPDAPEPAVLIGALMVQDGRLKEALPLYETLCQAESATGQTHLMLGGIYAALDRADEALEQWNRAIALDPELAEAYLRLARGYAERKDRERSLKHYRRFLALAERNPSKVEIPEGIQEEIMKVSAGAP